MQNDILSQAGVLSPDSAIDVYADSIEGLYDQMPQGDFSNHPLDHTLTREKSLEDLQIRFPFLPISPYGNSVHTIVLSAGVVKEVHVPSGSKMCKISAAESDDVFFSFGGVPAIPAVDILGSGVARVNSNEWIECAGRSNLGLICASSAIVTVRYFSQL